MNNAPVNFFNGANGMDASSKLPNFPGDFLGDVQVVLTKGITKRDGKRAFIAEVLVLTSNLPAVHVGGKYSWYQDLTEAGTAYPACIGFLYACLGVDPVADKVKIDTTIKPMQDKWLNDAANNNVLAGARIRLQTSEKLKKDFKNMSLDEARKLKGVFTLHTFSPAAVAV